MKRNWIPSKQTKYTAYLTLYLLVVLAVIGAVNWLANRHNKSLDTTANKRYSLSDQTEKVVKGLKQDVTILYFDKSTEFNRARDLLGRYDNLSPKLKVQYVDPDKNPTLATATGVRTYGSIFVTAGAKKEEARLLSEEEITGALIRTLKSEVRTVCALSGNGEHSFDDTERRSGYSTLKTLLERDNYQTRTISLLEKPEIPSDCTIVLVAGPRFDYLEPVVQTLKAWVEQGGSAMFLLDPPTSLGREVIAENARLVEVLKEWGVTLEKNLVLDLSPVGQLFGLGAAAPLVTQYQTHPIVREMRNVATAFPMVRSLKAQSAGKTSVETLASTGPDSLATEKLDAREIRTDSGKKGPFAIAAAGTFDTGQENKKGRFVVVGSSSWIANNFIGFNGNRNLALNMMNWLSADEELISIRPKDPDDRRLEMKASQMRFLGAFAVILLPLLVIGAGVGVWWKRR